MSSCSPHRDTVHAARACSQPNTFRMKLAPLCLCNCLVIEGFSLTIWSASWILVVSALFLKFWNDQLIIWRSDKFHMTSYAHPLLSLTFLLCGLLPSMSGFVQPCLHMSQFGHPNNEIHKRHMTITVTDLTFNQYLDLQSIGNYTRIKVPVSLWMCLADCMPLPHAWCPDGGSMKT